MSSFLQAATQKKTLLTSLRVALVVGTILGLINYGDRIFLHQNMATVDWVKLGITYLVPFCVATYGAARYATQNK